MALWLRQFNAEACPSPAGVCQVHVFPPSKLHGGGEFVIYEFIIFFHFFREKSMTFKKCISRNLKIDVVSQEILFNQNVIAFYRTPTRPLWIVLVKVTYYTSGTALFLAKLC